MTLQLEVAITAIQSLTPTERQQLLQILIQSDSLSNSQTSLKMLNDQFCQGFTLQQLLTTKTPTTVDNLKDLAADFWPQEDSIEDFLTFLRQQRQDPKELIIERRKILYKKYCKLDKLCNTY